MTSRNGTGKTRSIRSAGIRCRSSVGIPCFWFMEASGRLFERRILRSLLMVGLRVRHFSPPFSPKSKPLSYPRQAEQVVRHQELPKVL